MWCNNSKYVNTTYKNGGENMESDQTWNQVAKFMQQLRGENLSKKSIIQIPGQKNAKNELEKIQAIGKERMKHMKETEQRITQKLIECLEDNAS